MDETWIVGAFVIVIVPIVLSFLQVIDKSNKKTADLTAVIVKLNDKLDMLFDTEKRQDKVLDNHEERISTLEKDVIVIQKDIENH